MNTRYRQFLVFAVLLSALLHFLLLYRFQPAQARPEPPPKYIELATVPAMPKRIPPAPPPEPLLPPHGQVVDLGPQAPATPPPDQARFLAEFNSRAERETVRPGDGGLGGPARQRSENRPGSERPERAQPAGEPENRPAPETPNGARRPESVTREELMMNYADLGAPPSGAPGSIDYLPDVARGEITALNAREVAYAAFFNRIKKVIKFYWEPWLEVQRAGWRGQTLTTVVRFVTSAAGELKSVEILESCGYPGVDEAAVRAIRKAAPFYNVPPALLNSAGEFDVNFGFFITSE